MTAAIYYEAASEPDAGQRGSGVRVVHDVGEAEEYLAAIDAAGIDRKAQEDARRLVWSGAKASSVRQGAQWLASARGDRRRESLRQAG